MKRQRITSNKNSEHLYENDDTLAKKNNGLRKFILC